MTRKELHALMTGMIGNGFLKPKPMDCAQSALELLEAAEEVYAKSEGFRGTIEALEVAARRVIESFYAERADALVGEIANLRKALIALEPSSE